MNKKNKLLQQFINNEKLESDYDRLQCIRNDLAEFLGLQKKKFDIRSWAKLSYQSTSAKTHWSILKTFVNDRKVPLIRPLFAA